MCALGSSCKSTFTRGIGDLEWQGRGRDRETERTKMAPTSLPGLWTRLQLAFRVVLYWESTFSLRFKISKEASFMDIWGMDVSVGCFDAEPWGDSHYELLQAHWLALAW